MTSTTTIPATGTPAASPPTLDVVAVSTVRRLGRALVSEYVKLTTVRSYRAIAALTVTVGTLVTWGVARYVDDEPMTVAMLFLFASVFTAVFAAVAGSLWAVAFTTLSALLGLGVGMIARHSTVAISGLLVWWLVVENLLAVFLDPQLSRFLPFVAGNGLLQIVIDDPDALAAALSLPQNAAVFGGYSLLALVVGAALLHLRDAH